MPLLGTPQEVAEDRVGFININPPPFCLPTPKNFASKILPTETNILQWGLIPLGTPERANVAALSLRSYLREGKQIQTLRPHFDGKPISASRNHKFACWLKQTSKHCTRARKCHAPNDCKNLCLLLRTRFSTNSKQKRKAKILAKRLPAQKARRGYPAADALRQSRGRSRRDRPGALSWFVLCRAAKNEHQKSNRSARDKVAQYDRM